MSRHHRVWNTPLLSFGSAVLTMSPPKILPSPSLLEVVGNVGETALMLCKHCSAEVKTLMCYQHLSSYQYKAQQHEGCCQEMNSTSPELIRPQGTTAVPQGSWLTHSVSAGWCPSHSKTQLDVNKTNKKFRPGFLFLNLFLFSSASFFSNASLYLQKETVHQLRHQKQHPELQASASQSAVLAVSGRDDGTEPSPALGR